MGRTFNQGVKYWALGIVSFSLIVLAYFFGPESNLTLLSRLHYNALFILTPCIGEVKSYEDESIKFDYIEPPGILRHVDYYWVPNSNDLTYDSPFRHASEAIDMRISLKPSYKFKLPGGIPNSVEKTAKWPEPKIVNLKRGSGVIKIVYPMEKDLGFKDLYVTGKNDYIYSIPMPYYFERTVDGSWFFRALYHTEILPGSFTDIVKPRGFFTWLFTPCADKQMYCSSNMIIKSLEVK